MLSHLLIKIKLTSIMLNTIKNSIDSLLFKRPKRC